MPRDDVAATAREVVARELGERPTDVAHVTVGRSNRVMRVDTERGRSFAVRLSALGADRFAMEQAVMDRVRAVGVPVPHVRFVGPAASGTAGAVMVADWVEAPSVGAVVRDGGKAPDVAEGLAEVLAAVHSCDVTGFGNLDAGLRGVATNFQEWFVTGAAERVERSLDVIERYVPGGGRLPLRAVEVLAERSDSFADARPRLVHGDVSPDNLLVDGTSVAALIDWESAKGGPPSLDLGWLSYIDPQRTIDRERVIAGYAAITGSDVAELLVQSALVELRILATSAEWQARAGLVTEVPATLQRLSAALDDL